jgi:hypothetical protein
MSRINYIRDVFFDLLEKNNRGWIPPQRFNNYVDLGQQEIFESYFYDYNRWLSLEKTNQSHNDYANIPSNIREKIDIFLKTDVPVTASSGSIYPMPDDHYRLLEVYFGGDFVDQIDNRRVKLLNKSNLTAPSSTYPVYVRSENTNDDFPNIILYPTTIITGVTIDYIRKPLTPKWTYTEVGGNPIFNISANDYQDVEIHISDDFRLIQKVLGYAGVSIRENDIIQYSEVKEQQKKNTENRV